jgi:hypothetical protein
MGIEATDLVLHDWWNMTPAERQQAIDDVRALANSHTGRRARSLNVVASYFHFLTEKGPLR